MASPIPASPNSNGANIDPTQLTRQALANTVQQFPPPINAGAFLVGEMYRGPILPPYGTKERDRILRIYDRQEYNGLWQGATAGLIKKVRSTPWEIKGEAGYEYWANYYTAVLHHAQFGKGWGEFVSLLVRDFLTQDYGGFIELIGPGDPDGSITGPLGDMYRQSNDPIRYYGIAHKDAWRCYVTGNPTWPIVYYSLMTGKLHKMHHSRIRRVVDMPNPDERYFGIGLSALSRCIAIANREIRMGRYVDSYMDDKPKPGFAIVSGMTKPQWDLMWKGFQREQSNDDLPLWGRTAIGFSVDIDQPVDVKMIPFAQTPEKFDYIKYVDMDVNALALGLGVDRQELWELAGRGIGSGSQSQILALKSEGKAYGDLLQTLERLFNLSILPPGLTFRFKTKNTAADSAQADIDTKYAAIAQQLSSVPDLTTGSELRTILANKSQTFADAFTNSKGTIELEDSDVQPPEDEVRISDNAPAQALQNKPIDNSTAKAPTKPPVATKGYQLLRVKDFQSTRAEFVDTLVDLIGAKDDQTRRRFGIVFRATLRRLGQQAFKDGLEAGGVTGELDDDDLAQIQHWLISQSNYISSFADEVYRQGLTPTEIAARAELWANKSLETIYSEGVLSADRNGMYEFVLGRTEKHCRDCLRLNGQRHRYKEWYSRSLIPRSDGVRTECGGWNCQCRLVKSTEPARGRF